MIVEISLNTVKHLAESKDARRNVEFAVNDAKNGDFVYCDRTEAAIMVQNRRRIWFGTRDNGEINYVFMEKLIDGKLFVWLSQ